MNKDSVYGSICGPHGTDFHTNVVHHVAWNHAGVEIGIIRFSIAMLKEKQSA